MKNKAKKLILLIATLMILASLASCGNPDIDISSYKDEKVEIIGIEDKPVFLTIADLKDMELKTKKTSSTSEKIGKIKATGPLLSTVLEAYGKKQEDYKSIIIYAVDEYEIKLDKDFLKENDLILAFGIDEEPLGKDSRPLRLIVPRSDSGYWIRQIKKIELVS